MPTRIPTFLPSRIPTARPTPTPTYIPSSSPSTRTPTFVNSLEDYFSASENGKPIPEFDNVSPRAQVKTPSPGNDAIVTFSAADNAALDLMP